MTDLGEIRPTGWKYRPRSPLCPGRWAENFFEKLCLVPLLLEFWIFNNRLIFWAFHGLSSQNHYSDELRADLISLFPVSISLLVQILSVCISFFLPPFWNLNARTREHLGPFGPIWAYLDHFGPIWAHMAQARFWRFLNFWSFWVCQLNMFFWIFGSLMAPSDFFFVRKMLTFWLSNFHKFIEMCQIYWVLLSWFYFSDKNNCVKLSHLESVLKEFCTFKTSGLPGPSQFIFWNKTF